MSIQIKFLSYLFVVICLLNFTSCDESSDVSSSDVATLKCGNKKAELECQKKIKDSLNMAKEEVIREKLQGNIWLKKKDEKNYHLYSFSDSSLSLINCKGFVNYSLVVDTIKFSNESSTMAIVSFNENGDLLLKEIKTGEQGLYKVAKDQDKFIGNWTGQLENLKINLFKLDLNPGGKGLLTDGNGTTSCSYSYIKKNLALNFNGAIINYKTNLSRLNTMTQTNSNWSRQMKTFPKNLSILF